MSYHQLAYTVNLLGWDPLYLLKTEKLLSNTTPTRSTPTQINIFKHWKEFKAENMLDSA